MQNRHRVPNVFTLYMVDVLCCALGCVILLWFLKLNEAKRHVAEADRQAQAARTTGERLHATELERDTIRTARDAALLRAGTAEKDRDASLARIAEVESELARLQQDRDAVLARADSAEKDRDRVRRDRDLARGRLVELDKSIAALLTDKSAAEARLSKKMQEQ